MSSVQDDDEQVTIEPVSTMHGLPLYVFDKSQYDDADEAIKAIRASGEQIFYVLADLKSQHVTKKGHVETVTYTHSPRLFKVVSNLVGNAVSALSGEVDSLTTVSESAFFTLPAIPYALIERVDTFFRHVNDKYGTEAVVLFTFDPDYLGEENAGDGWGILVPEQNNTAGSCNYDATTVIDDKDDHLFIVGTAHSHPEMSAYCSGTDKTDQMYMDGIHITFGWNKGSNITDHYIELQMAGSAYTLKPQDAFADLPEMEVDDEIENWTKKVTKKHVATGTPYGYGGYESDLWSHTSYSHLPTKLPSPSSTHCIIVKTNLSLDELKDCPVCQQAYISDFVKMGGKCTYCHSYVITTDDKDLAGLITRRCDELKIKDLNGHQIRDLTVHDGTQYKNIWLWDETDKDKIELLSEGTSKKETRGQVHTRYYSGAGGNRGGGSSPR